MGTSNFHYVNTSMCFAVIPNDNDGNCADDFDWYDCQDYMIDLFRQNFGKENVHKGGFDPYELRSFPSRCVVQGRCPVTGNWITAVLRSGYYEGACWDWVEEDGAVSMDTIAMVEGMFAEGCTDTLRRVATFSNGETVYSKVN